MKRMKAFFDRHQVDKHAEGFHEGEKGFPSPGRVAWDAWGGDAGYAWVKRELGHDDVAEKSLLQIKQWRENSLNRVKKGLPTRRFDDMPAFVADPIWNRLEAAKTREEVLLAFSGDILSGIERINPVEKEKPNKKLGRRAAGIAVQARDTGRVVMIQRTPDKHDDDDANARWEWPGGKLDGGGDGREDESVWAGALREWHEETGAVMPPDAEICGGWLSDDGDYEGFVVRVPHETDITFDPQPEETAAAGWWHPDDLDDDDIRQKVHDQLGDLQPLLDEETE
jgi:8-oxo-dGTP pyrophosphatase MutT (NUDIX family)